MDLENTESQMRKGILELCILAVIRRQELYATEIIKQLKDSGLKVLEGTLYPLLTRLKNAGLVRYRWVENTSGPPRKYFALTAAGEAFYGSLAGTWQELSRAVTALCHPDQARNGAVPAAGTLEAAFAADEGDGKEPP